MKMILAMAATAAALGATACGTTETFTRAEVEEIAFRSFEAGREEESRSSYRSDDERVRQSGGRESYRERGEIHVRGGSGSKEPEKTCNTGVHFENFSKTAMTQEQFAELRDYLKNAGEGCSKRPPPKWLKTESDWSYGDTVPAKGEFSMNGVKIVFWEITR